MLLLECQTEQVQAVHLVSGRYYPSLHSASSPERLQAGALLLQGAPTARHLNLCTYLYTGAPEIVNELSFALHTLCLLQHYIDRTGLPATHLITSGFYNNVVKAQYQKAPDGSYVWTHNGGQEKPSPWCATETIGESAAGKVASHSRHVICLCLYLTNVLRCLICGNLASLSHCVLSGDL